MCNIPDHQVTLQGRVLACYVRLELQPIKVQFKRYIASTKIIMTIQLQTG
jgi:hypothetical protein